MRPPPALRQARHDGTLRMLAEARECIARIGAAAAPQLSASTKHAAQQLAMLAQARLAALQALPPHTAEAWTAAANLARALEKIDAVISAPEAWAGMPLLFEAQHLLGAADVQTGAAVLAADQRAVAVVHGRKGGRPSKAGRDAELAGRFAERQRSHRTLTTRELYDDIAAEFGVEWWTVRDAVLKATPAG